MAPRRQGALGSYVSLFSSVGTLLCCAVPSLLVLVGLGATMATVLSAAPWLVVLSQHKDWIFGASGVLIASNFLYIYRLAPTLRSDGAGCRGAGNCEQASAASRIVLWLSAALYAAGFFLAFALSPILTRFAA